MYSNKILDFAKEQVIEVTKKVVSKEKQIERQFADLSKWFGENDTIEFDDSFGTFINLKAGADIMKGFEGIQLKIWRDGAEVELKKEQVHCIMTLNKCLFSFFTEGV